MYPGPEAPDLGTFVADLEARLADRGHELARAVVDRRGGRLRHVVLARDVVATARRFRPDVVYAHFLVPAGLLAVVAGGAPAVVTAHGQDVENAVRSALVRHGNPHHGSARRRDRGRLRVASLATRVRRARGPRPCRGDRLRCRPGPIRARRPGVGPRRDRLAAGRDRVRLRRIVDGAEERAAAGARVRAARRGLARLRRRRRPARRARGQAGHPSRGSRSRTRRSPGGSRPPTSSASRASRSRSVS